MDFVKRVMLMELKYYAGATLVPSTSHVLCEVVYSECCHHKSYIGGNSRSDTFPPIESGKKSTRNEQHHTLLHFDLSQKSEIKT